ncbi:hypothetical protein [Serratia fonticola]|uniref:hypothetical protein n=1 Tax=Serratia fonticola TaxID=47917 RepID=UPI001268D8C5|nr:hypothetical protein [Serratia fonticola]MEB7886354.1 hypothetical protein [Serratia fonticola]
MIYHLWKIDIADGIGREHLLTEDAAAIRCRCGIQHTSVGQKGSCTILPTNLSKNNTFTAGTSTIVSPPGGTRGACHTVHELP